MKTKQLNHLNKVTQDALKHGACAWIEKIDDSISIEWVNEFYVSYTVNGEKRFTPKYKFKEVYLKHQIGDKVYLAEDFYENETIFYKDDGWSEDYFLVPNAHEMTYEQARHKGVVVDVKIIRVKDMTYNQMFYIGVEHCSELNTIYECVEMYCKQLEINYDSDEYVVYTEIKRGE